MRLIDAEPFNFNKVIVKVIIPDGGPNFKRGYALGAKHVCDEIDNAPTIDAISVIRCKDCECMNKIGGMCYCEHHDFCVQPDFYCADGANLKMEEQNG